MVISTVSQTIVSGATQYRALLNDGASGGDKGLGFLGDDRRSSVLTLAPTLARARPPTRELGWSIALMARGG